MSTRPTMTHFEFTLPKDAVFDYKTQLTAFRNLPQVTGVALGITESQDSVTVTAPIVLKKLFEANNGILTLSTPSGPFILQLTNNLKCFHYTFQVGNLALAKDLDFLRTQHQCVYLRPHFYKGVPEAYTGKWYYAAFSEKPLPPFQFDNRDVPFVQVEPSVSSSSSSSNGHDKNFKKRKQK